MATKIKIISGGQTGVERGALDAAIAAGVDCGGWCPRGRLAEDGALDKSYPLKETTSEDVHVSTLKNVHEADATVIIYFGKLEGITLESIEYCRQHNKPHLLVNTDFAKPEKAVEAIKKFVIDKKLITINITGPSASKVPRARTYAQIVIAGLFRELQIESPSA